MQKKVVKEVRALIHASNKTGRVLIISNRLYGTGPYSKTLAGLDHQRTGKGVLSPVIAYWLDQAIQQVPERFKGPTWVAEPKLGHPSTFTTVQ